MSDTLIALIAGALIVIVAVVLILRRKDSVKTPASSANPPDTSTVTRTETDTPNSKNTYSERLPLGECRKIPEEVHRIPRRKLDDNAMKVVYRLNDEGHEAYLVGGCIRDLLLKQHPKDFDVATSAHPEQAEELFRRSRLIGRRFKLVHVRFGREIIEVATFRAAHDQGNAEHGRHAANGMIVRDNVYGTIEEDALRRDFTVNALYYSAVDHCIYDFANGYPDLLNEHIRRIGDPAERYREDPVRMLRAARFAAKLGFQIEPETATPIHQLGSMLANIAPARMFDESLKLFQGGYGEAVYRQLKRFNLFVQLFPQTAEMLDDDRYPVDTLVNQALQNTDRRLNQGKSVTPAFLFAALLWYPMQARFRELSAAKQMPIMQCLHEAANDVLGAQVRRTAIPRRFSTPVREIWELQLRLPRKHRADQTMEHPRFRAAYDLLLLREQSGEELEGLGQWWTEYQHSNAEHRDEMRQRAPVSSAQKRRRKPRRKPAAPDNSQES